MRKLLADIIEDWVGCWIGEDENQVTDEEHRSLFQTNNYDWSYSLFRSETEDDVVVKFYHRGYGEFLVLVVARENPMYFLLDPEANELPVGEN